MRHHPNQGRWQEEGSLVTLRSAAKGQEFVLDGALYLELELWVAGLVRGSAG